MKAPAGQVIQDQTVSVVFMFSCTSTFVKTKQVSVSILALTVPNFAVKCPKLSVIKTVSMDFCIL